MISAPCFPLNNFTREKIKGDHPFEILSFSGQESIQFLITGNEIEWEIGESGIVKNVLHTSLSMNMSV